jgi:hypothetical protein
MRPDRTDRGKECAPGTHTDVSKERQGQAPTSRGHQRNAQDHPGLAGPCRARHCHRDRSATRLGAPGGAQPARVHLRRRPPSDGRRRCGGRAPEWEPGRLPLLPRRAGSMANAPSHGRCAGARRGRPSQGPRDRTRRLSGTDRPALPGARIGGLVRRPAPRPGVSGVRHRCAPPDGKLRPVRARGEWNAGSSIGPLHAGGDSHVGCLPRDEDRAALGGGAPGQSPLSTSSSSMG